MKLCQITNKENLAAYFHQDLPLHAYSLGDLDDLYWLNTTYYGEIKGEAIDRVTTLYRGGEGLPVLLALGPEGFLGEDYYQALTPFLPDSFYGHFSPGLQGFFQENYQLTDFGKHYKMSLIDPGALTKPNSENLFQLKISHLGELLELYQLSYPDNAFDPLMLSTGKYIGCRSNGMLVSVAGVHVYSSRFRVATLGNIATHPEHRNQGFGRRVTSALCLDLLGEVDFIGLNVKADNPPALHLYRSLGFEISAKYGEFSLKRQFFG